MVTVYEAVAAVLAGLRRQREGKELGAEAPSQVRGPGGPAVAVQNTIERRRTVSPVMSANVSATRITPEL